MALCYVAFNTNPFMISLLAYLVNGESIARFELIGMILCFIGILILFRSALNDLSATGNEIIGILGALICSFNFGICAVVNR